MAWGSGKAAGADNDHGRTSNQSDGGYNDPGGYGEGGRGDQGNTNDGSNQQGQTGQPVGNKKGEDNAPTGPQTTDDKPANKAVGMPDATGLMEPTKESPAAKQSQKSLAKSFESKVASGLTPNVNEKNAYAREHGMFAPGMGRQVADSVATNKARNKASAEHAATSSNRMSQQKAMQDAIVNSTLNATQKMAAIDALHRSDYSSLSGMLAGKGVYGAMSPDQLESSLTDRFGDMTPAHARNELAGLGVYSDEDLKGHMSNTAAKAIGKLGLTTAMMGLNPVSALTGLASLVADEKELSDLNDYAGGGYLLGKKTVDPAVAGSDVAQAGQASAPARSSNGVSSTAAIEQYLRSLLDEVKDDEGLSEGMPTTEVGYFDMPEFENILQNDFILV